ncbi:MAG: methyl-accepting chemotaxis protein [Leptospiraceae bacterium]|nr:hypothetical protein [Leptospiraceae bacterium]MCP5510431.1 methyl-accepting chemotaxis protein [Leptospiraceae bacterium]
MEKSKGLSGKGLAKPGLGKGIDHSFDKNVELQQRRDDAKKIAAEKAKARTMAKQQQISERIATAAEQLSSGIQEGSSASEELMRSMQQIASGAEEASSAAEESKATITQIEKGSQINSNLAEDTLNKVQSLKEVAQNTGRDINLLIEGVKAAADSAISTAKLMQELEKQSDEIGNIVQSVVRIADQTNLLALNAAIEAARAGEHGRGFAIVADEVRNLAETSEKSANRIKDVVAEIQTEVRKVVQEINQIGKSAKDEAEKGVAIANGLMEFVNSMVRFAEISAQTEKGVAEILGYSKEFLKVSENVAAAAEELTASAEESRKGTEQQAKAFSEMSSAAEELAQTAEELKNSTNLQKSAEELASMSEQLSANIEEALSASQELAKAIEQIQKATEIQSRETVRGADLGERLGAINLQVETNSTEMKTQSKTLSANLATSKTEIDTMIRNIGLSATKNLDASKVVRGLGDKSMAIDKIVEAIINVAIKTDMLAVSGSIEAARAGEHGKGFSVVSGDIRNLATESSESADKIKNLVRSLSILIDRSSRDVEMSGTIAQTEVQKAKVTTDSLSRMEDDMKAIDRAMDAMLRNSAESKQANEEARKAVDNISAAAEEAVKSVTQASAASEEQAKGLQELSEAIEEIAALADELQSG